MACFFMVLLSYITRPPFLTFFSNTLFFTSGFQPFLFVYKVLFNELRARARPTNLVLTRGEQLIVKLFGHSTKYVVY